MIFIDNMYRVFVKNLYILIYIILRNDIIYKNYVDFINLFNVLVRVKKMGVLVVFWLGNIEYMLFCLSIILFYYVFV